MVDLLDAALGTVVGIRAHGDLQGWIGLLLDHEGGARSEASLTAYSPGGPARAGVEIHTADGSSRCDGRRASAAAATAIDEFVDTARTGRHHSLDVHRGLHLQRLLAVAADDLG